LVYTQMKKQTEKIHNIMRRIAKEEGLPLVVQGPLLCGAYHCCENELLIPSEYSEEIQIKDIILNAALQRNGILVSSISRIYPNISLNDNDVDWFEEHAGRAIREAKTLINEIYE